jgi:hypothetical protein
MSLTSDSSNNFPNISLMFPEIVNYVIFTLALNYYDILPLIQLHIAISMNLTKTRGEAEDADIVVTVDIK